MPPELEQNIKMVPATKVEIKRKRNELDLQTKLKLIHEIERGEKSKTRVAQDFGIPLTTLVTVYKNRKKIEEQIYVGGALVKRKRVRGAKYGNLEKNLLKLFRNMSDCNLPLSGPIVKEKANNMAVRLGIQDFKCSNGWLQRFKLRNNLIFRKCSNEDHDTYNDIENDFKEEHEKLEEDEEEEEEDEEEVEQQEEQNHTIESKFHHNEEVMVQEPEIVPLSTVSNEREEYMVNNRELIHNEQNTHSENEEEEEEEKIIAKSPLTLLICCDCDSNDKMRPLVVCKCSKPRCFQEVNSFDTHSMQNKSCIRRISNINITKPSKNEALNSLIILEKVLTTGKITPKNEVLVAFDEISSFVKNVYKQNQLKIDDFFKPKTKY